MTKKICIITCYKQPDYVRAVVLRKALMQNKDYQVEVVKNSTHNIFRYVEVAWKALKVKITNKPDIIIVTFRGYEILPLILLIKGKSRVVFDEFINLVEWLEYEHGKISSKSTLGKTIKSVYRYMLRKTDKILADTDAHANYSAKLMNLPKNKYRAIPVGTDEDTFYPRKNTSSTFKVMYYGNMLPLHGINDVLSAAVILKAEKIDFLIVGGKENVRAAVIESRQKGANIKYLEWIAYNDLPEEIGNSSLFLGGPFGNTIQSQYVITGKTYQALAMGVPVLTGKVQGDNPLDDKENCLIVKQGSAVDIASAIMWASKNRSRLVKIGKNGRKLFEQYYATEHIQAKLDGIINELIKVKEDS